MQPKTARRRFRIIARRAPDVAALGRRRLILQDPARPLAPQLPLDIVGELPSDPNRENMLANVLAALRRLTQGAA